MGAVNYSILFYSILVCRATIQTIREYLNTSASRRLIFPCRSLGTCRERCWSGARRARSACDRNFPFLVHASSRHLLVSPPSSSARCTVPDRSAHRARSLHYATPAAAHIPHEGNSEQLFSRSGALSDSNGKMDPPPGAAGSLDVHRRQLLDLPAEQ
jgi:hypothetical protein